VVLAAGFLVFAAAQSGLANDRGSTQASLLEAVNAARVSHGLRSLRLDSSLERAARAHTQEMLRDDYFGHGDFPGRMNAFHLRGALGENLAWGSGPYSRASSIVQIWLTSAGHRANLLRPGFRHIGFGLATGTFQGQSGATVVTADFGS